MKLFWSQDLFNKAFIYAAEAHNGQNVPGTTLPYITHIACVCTELIAVIDETIDGDFALQCAALHDTIEDTKVTYSLLEQHFGKKIADGVDALTKNRNLDKSLQVQDSLDRILKQPKEIWMVKMADRITNLNPPPNTWSSEKKKAYFEQSHILLNALSKANENLAERFATKINEYKAYL